MSAAAATVAPGATRLVNWTSTCRFQLIIFSTVAADADDDGADVGCSLRRLSRHRPFKFRHTERPGARGTLLAESNLNTHLRAWDFTTGAPFRSTHPIVFSFSGATPLPVDFQFDLHLDALRLPYDCFLLLGAFNCPQVALLIALLIAL